MRCCQIMCLKLNLHKKFNFFCCSSIVRTVFAFFPGVVSVRQVACFKRKERSCTGLETATLSLHGAAVWRSVWKRNQHLASIDMLWKLDGKKFASSVLQEVLIVTISERKFKGGGMWQRQLSIIISQFFSPKTKSNFSLMWKLLRTLFFPQNDIVFPTLCMKRSFSCCF